MWYYAIFTRKTGKVVLCTFNEEVALSYLHVIDEQGERVFDYQSHFKEGED